MLTEQKQVWSVYLIRTAQGKIYTGISTDVKRRFHEHQDGGKLAAKFLRGKGPLSLEFFAKVGDRSTASRLEYQVKKLSRIEKAKIISGELLITDLLSDPLPCLVK
jgi:putative endonuclease